MSGGPEFKFRLERVRALRERDEEKAKEELAASMAERARQAERLARAAERLNGARDAQRGAATGGADAFELQARQAFLEASERFERAVELDMHRHEAEVDARRAALQAAAERRHVLERLKERKAEEHRLEAGRREGAELDEIAIGRHVRRRGRAA